MYGVENEILDCVMNIVCIYYMCGKSEVRGVVNVVLLVLMKFEFGFYVSF